MRFVHVFVICALVFAAAHVYHIKMESTVRMERVLKLRADIRAQRDAIAALRAEWARLETPGRLQGLATKHLGLRPVESQQYDRLKNLPERPPSFAKPDVADPIGAMLDVIEQQEVITGSVTKTEDDEQ
ncbi:MAG: cell division protein FtsL [Pseudomonadota bacterium]|jgi:cell division protein FtsL